MGYFSNLFVSEREGSNHRRTSVKVQEKRISATKQGTTETSIMGDERKDPPGETNLPLPSTPHQEKIAGWQAGDQTLENIITNMEFRRHPGDPVSISLGQE